MHINTKWASGPGMLCNIGYPFETNLKIKSHKIAFANNICFTRPIVIDFAHSTADADTVVVNEKFQDD